MGILASAMYWAVVIVVASYGAYVVSTLLMGGTPWPFDGGIRRK